ncbi:hypothetical protein AB0B01_05590 [Streptomyces sp. NPDC044571]|uniref:hypothetical protein n=1 Tax=Streptomyces sp. NPDC044571 TaxID=3155371 RepID=UPI0033C81065
MTSPTESGTDFHPTHVVPQEGLPAWEAPDVSRPTAPLDPFLPVQLLSRQGAWAEILCSNGWSAWVDGRLLVSVPQPPPAGGGQPTRAEDPRPLLARSTDILARYRQAAEELASGLVDPGRFRDGTRGLRAGVVIDGESVWLYDESTGRWMYGDGGHLVTYAVVTGPGGSEQPSAAEPEPGAATGGPGRAAQADDREPTRVVMPPEAREG